MKVFFGAFAHQKGGHDIVYGGVIVLAESKDEAIGYLIRAQGKDRDYTVQEMPAEFSALAADGKRYDIRVTLESTDR